MPSLHRSGSLLSVESIKVKHHYMLYHYILPEILLMEKKNNLQILNKFALFFKRHEEFDNHVCDWKLETW
jgi:hypothetical protein